MTDQKKVVLASPEWIDLAGRLLADVAREYADEDVSVSMCQRFVEAPPEFADDDGSSSWCFYIEGKNVRFHRGMSREVDVFMQATWELELPGARRVYTPELIAEYEENPPERHEDPNLRVEGDYEAKRPAWLLEWHNRLAPHTA